MLWWKSGRYSSCNSILNCVICPLSVFLHPIQLLCCFYFFDIIFISSLHCNSKSKALSFEGVCIKVDAIMNKIKSSYCSCSVQEWVDEIKMELQKVLKGREDHLNAMVLSYDSTQVTLCFIFDTYKLLLNYIFHPLLTTVKLSNCTF
jgi:hypothetical protein